ncbi:MAG: hypothetical protein ACE5HS_07180 [bacterium]
MDRKQFKVIHVTALGFVILLFLMSCLSAVPEDVSFQLFFTSDLYGYLKPCG